MLNKSDAADADALAALQREMRGVIISARERTGLDELLRAIEQQLGRPDRFAVDPSPLARDGATA